jgi:hypothetical protein
LTCHIIIEKYDDDVGGDLAVHALKNNQLSQMVAFGSYTKICHDCVKEIKFLDKFKGYNSWNN